MECLVRNERLWRAVADLSETVAIQIFPQRTNETDQTLKIIIQCLKIPIKNLQAQEYLNLYSIYIEYSSTFVKNILYFGNLFYFQKHNTKKEFRET